jgi:outer membrane protein, heavy metal efflux system
MEFLNKPLAYFIQIIKHSVLLLSLMIFITVKGKSQSSIDTILASIVKNNKSIQANIQYWETRKLQYKVGLAPTNPQVEYDYLVGRPDNAGNQTEVTAFQSFDFPSAYIKRKQLSEKQVTQAEQHIISKRQDILMEAKKVCIELVYRNKLLKEITIRKNSGETLLKSFEAKLNKGDGNILDVNKARLQLISINYEFQENVSVISQLNSQLTSLNGGEAIILSDTVYFVLPDIPTFEELEAQFEAADPLRQILEQEKLIAQKEIELSRALSYPKFEAGYHYQGILGQKYNGIHTGISIPLWENKNTVKTQKSKMLFADLELQNHRNEHYYEIKQLYERYKYLMITVNEYQSTLLSLNNIYLLNKSLNSGHISTIEFFTEMNYYATAFNTYLKIEKDYYQTIAELYKFLL